MKKLQMIMMAALMLWSVNLFAQSGDARLQVIHNSADPAAEVVDIYVNGGLFIDNFEFRTATAFNDVPAGVQLNIGIAPGNSVDANDIIATIPVTLESGETYVAIANGVLDSSMFAGNPDGKSISFALYPRDNIRESARWSRFVDFVVFHGSTDAPAVDVLRNTILGKKLVNNLYYGDFSSYRTVRPQEYILDITPAYDNNTVVASFEADLSGLGGGAAVVFASGFLNPAANMNGASFGLFAALPDGTVVEFPKIQPTARLQVIHNSADPAAEVVDVYVNGGLFINDFAFRSATEFMDVPAGVQLDIGIAPGNSVDANDIIATIPVTLEEDETYIAVANGVLDVNMFASNPDMVPIGFNLYAKDHMRESAHRWYNVDVAVFHGSTDAPTVDVFVRGLDGGPVVDDLTYTDFTDYLPLLPKSYILDITPGNDNSTVVASFEADLSGLRGGAALVFASGFFDPSANMNGAGFGLFAALPNGVVVELPAVPVEMPMARLQIIHNSADPGAEMVDIYVNGGLFLDNFAFREATAFTDVPAGVTLDIGVAPPNSVGPQDIIATIPAMFERDETYVAIANGVLDPSMFAENPDDMPTGFNLYVQDNIRENAKWHWLVDLQVFHGATDAPTVDVVSSGWWWNYVIVNNLTYGEFSGYRNLFPVVYTLDVTPGNDNNTVVASYKADLRGLRGGAAVVFASGFLNPAGNMDGEAFGLFAALPDGTVIELPSADNKNFALKSASLKSTSTLPEEYDLAQNYPNPFNPTTTISFSLPEAGHVSLKVYNILGQEVRSLLNEYRDAGVHKVHFDADNLSSGMYFYRLTSESFSESKKMMLVK